MTDNGYNELVKKFGKTQADYIRAFDERQQGEKAKQQKRTAVYTKPSVTAPPPAAGQPQGNFAPKTAPAAFGKWAAMDVHEGTFNRQVQKKRAFESWPKPQTDPITRFLSMAGYLREERQQSQSIGPSETYGNQGRSQLTELIQALKDLTKEIRDIKGTSQQQPGIQPNGQFVPSAPRQSPVPQTNRTGATRNGAGGFEFALLRSLFGGR